MALRILHRFRLADTPATTDQLRADAVATRAVDGCLEAEAYRGLRERTDVAMVQLWSSEAAYADYLASAPSTTALRLADADEALTEIYAQTSFAPVEGVWTPVPAEGAGAASAISWPARGEVRIAIQTALADTAAESAALIANEAETLREPGCLDFAWMSGVENDSHILLLEAWSSQRIYDQHWILRRRTASAPARTPGERTLGSNSAEFYRREQFRRLYGRWLPTDSSAWSTTVDWPA